MAKNPFVDGVINVAIPDSPNGVYMRCHKIEGDLFGIDAVIGEYFNLVGMKVGMEAFLEGIKVDGDLDVTEMQVSGNGYFNGAEIQGDANFKGIIAGVSLCLSNARFAKDVNLSCAEINEVALIDRVRIGGNLYVDGGKFGCIDLENSVVNGDVRFLRSNVRHTGSMLTNTTIKGRLFLEDAVIEEEIVCEGLVVGSYSMNSNTRIPDNLRQVLEQYKRVETTPVNELIPPHY